jgi:hypothetical protein
VTPGVTVRAYGAGGAVAAERPYQDVWGDALNGLVEPEIKGW